MRIVVHEIKRNGVVTIDTGNGRIQGKWVGKLPEENSIIDIEVEIIDTLEWNKDITKESVSSYECGFSNDIISFVGYVEPVDDDGYTVIRFGGSIICLDTVGVPFSIGEFIKLVANNIEFYETRL